MRNNTMAVIEKFRKSGAITPKYDFYVKDADDIWNHSKDPFTAICNAFVFGFAQGYKAATAKKVTRQRRVKNDKK